MAEETKKKRGRPPKQKIDEKTAKNEEKEQIHMSQISNSFQNVFIKHKGKNLTYSDYLTAFGTSFKNNPFIQNDRIKRINAPIHGSKKTTINNALESPEDNELLLRSESQALYFQSYVYNNLIKINREVPMCFNYVTPCDVDIKTCQKEDWKKEWKFVNRFVEKFDLRRICKDIAIDVALEGKKSYVYRGSYDKAKGIVNFALLQKLPTKWVKYTSIGSNSPLITSFDFMMFLQAGESVDYYPPFFREVWDDLLEKGIFYKDRDEQMKFNPSKVSSAQYTMEYTKDNYMYWVELPQDLVFEFGGDNSHVLQIPDYVGLFTDFRGIDDYKWLQNQLLSKSINSVLVGTVPMINNSQKAGQDETALSMDTIIGFSDMFTNAVSNNIMPFFAPFEDYKLLSLPLPPDAKEIVNTSLKNTINSTGIGALISTTDKPSIISVKTAQQLSEAKAEYLNLQIQTCINNIIERQLGLKYHFKVTIWGGKFTYQDELSLYKELLITGVPSVLPRLLSTINQTMDDCDSINSYLASINLYDRFKPFTSITKEQQNENTNDNMLSKKIGRPAVGNDIENDNTATSLDIGNNVSDIKKFHNQVCAKCGTKLFNEQILCDECLQELYETRLDELIDETISKNKEE